MRKGGPGRGGGDEKRVSRGDEEVIEIGQSCTTLECYSIEKVQRGRG